MEIAGDWLPKGAPFTSWTLSQDGAPTIDMTLPDGISIGPTPYGHGIFATQHFSKGQVIYASHALQLPYMDGTIQLLTNPGSYTLDMQTHSVEQDTGLWQLYSFDAFTNHSCNPTSFSSQSVMSEDGKRAEFAQIAARDIEPGMEITCDYNLFEWDCTDKGIESCACGEACCQGRVCGYKFLTEDKQRQFLPIAYIEVINAWLALHPEILLRYITVPPQLKLCKTSDSEDSGWTLVATRQFEKGDQILKLTTEVIDVTTVKEFIVAFHDLRWKTNMASGMWHADMANGMKNLDLNAVNRGNGQFEFLGFATFCQHSCRKSGNPNMSITRESDNQLTYDALRTINVGEEVTCDWEMPARLD